MRYQYTHEATVQRLGTYASNKSTFASVGSTIRGFFIPMSPQQSVTVFGQIGQGYQFTTDGSKDILVNDTLTIDGLVYKVAGIARYRMASQDILQVTLQRQANG